MKLGLGVGLGLNKASEDIFDPLTIASLRGWWSAGFGVTKDGSDNVIQVDDRSGNGRHAIQSVGANQPEFVADGGDNFNNNAIIRFNASTDFLRIADFDYGDFTKLNVWVVWKRNGATPTSKYVIAHADLATGFSWYMFTGLTTITTTLSQTGAAVAKQYRDTLVGNVVQLRSFDYNVNTLNTFRDGVLQVPIKEVDDVMANLFDAAADMTIGCILSGGAPTNFQAMDWAETIITGDASNEQKANVDGLLLNKFIN